MLLSHMVLLQGEADVATVRHDGGGRERGGGLVRLVLLLLLGCFVLQVACLL